LSIRFWFSPRSCCMSALHDPWPPCPSVAPFFLFRAAHKGKIGPYIGPYGPYSSIGERANFKKNTSLCCHTLGRGMGGSQCPSACRQSRDAKDPWGMTFLRPLGVTGSTSGRLDTQFSLRLDDIVHMQILMVSARA